MSESDTRKPIFHTTSTFIAASAGTGKTYQLASRYIALLMLGVDPAAIIALTFTRKAAGEFRSRILHALAEGACDIRDEKNGRNKLAMRIWQVWSALDQPTADSYEKSALRYPLLPPTVPVVKLAASRGLYPEDLYSSADGKELRDYLQLPEQTPEVFARLLRKMVMAMSQVELSTIDSFFGKLVAGNCAELGIDSISAMEPAKEQDVRRSMIEDYLAARTAEDKKRAEFLNMFADLTGGKGCRTVETLEQQLKSYLSLYRDNPCMKAWTDVSFFEKNCTGNFVSLTREEAAEWDRKVYDLRVILGRFQTSDFERNVYSGLEKLANGKVEIGTTVPKWIANAPTDKTGNEEKFSEIKRIHSLAKDIVAGFPAKCLYDARVRTRSLYSLLRDYADAYEKRLTCTGEFSFDDISRKARELMTREYGDGDVDSFAYCREHLALRTGQKYQHWMLDEFQDTSDAQFDTLSPVLQQVIGESPVPFTSESPRPLPPSLRPFHEDSEYYVSDGSLFVVGDEKQGIYGFRGGESQAFGKFMTDPTWSEPILSAPLTQSYRSSRVIMGKDGFVNELFRKLNGIEAADNGENAVNLVPFTGHDSAQNLPGYVEMQVIEKKEADTTGEDDESGSSADEAVSNILRRLTVDGRKPVNGISIGILTRTNKEAEALVNHLRDEMPELPVLLVKETLSATFCPLGEMLHHLFRWLQHPHEQTSCRILKASFMFVLFRGHRTDEAAWLSLRRELETTGYTNLLKRVLSAFDFGSLSPEQQQAHRTFMATWLNAARAFDAEGGSLADWVRRISTLTSQGVASSRYVQVMTIHKSKGLEFDAVILPLTDKKAIDNEKDLTYFRAPDGSSVLLRPKGVKSELCLQNWSGAFDDQVSAWKCSHRREAYNLLYVAVTRARYANYILLNGCNLTAGSERSESGLIRRAFGGRTGKYDNTELLVEPVGNEFWYEQKKKPENSHTVPGAEAVSEPLGCPVPFRRKLSPSELSKEEDAQRQEAEDKPVPHYGNGSGVELGTAVHACWEQVSRLGENEPEWMEQPTLTEQRIVAAALQQPDVRALFTLRPDQEAYNEQRIAAVNDADNTWISGTIDRLILTTDAAGQVTAAHIIDYKTNQLVPGPDGKDAYEVLMEKHTAQMTAYRRLIAAAFPAAAVSVSLVSCPEDAEARVLTYTDARLPLK